MAKTLELRLTLTNTEDGRLQMQADALDPTKAMSPEETEMFKTFTVMLMIAAKKLDPDAVSTLVGTDKDGNEAVAHG